MRKWMKLTIAFGLACLLQTTVWATPANTASGWAKQIVEEAYSLGIVPDELMNKCQENITRKEFCALAMGFYELVSGKSGTTISSSPFYDDQSPYVAKCAELGIVKGVSETMFMPDDPLMREQIATLLMKTMEVSDEEIGEVRHQTAFRDANDIDADAMEAVNFLASQKILSGYDGYFYPKGFVTVEEAVSLFLNAYKCYRVEPVIVNGKSVSLGQEQSFVIDALGEPDEINENVYGFERYIYKNDTQTAIMVGFQNGKVKEIFTNASSFQYQNITPQTNAYLLKGEKNGAIVNVLENYRATVEAGIDASGGGVVDSIYIRDNRLPLAYENYTDEFASQSAAELFDLLMLKRQRMGLPVLEWDDVVADVAKNHSIDMTTDAMISYTGSGGETPFERMKEAGIVFSMAAENVSNTKGDSIGIYQEWIGTFGTSTNVLSKDYTHCGMGAVVDGFRIFTTMDFYRE